MSIPQPLPDRPCSSCSCCARNPTGTPMKSCPLPFTGTGSAGAEGVIELALGDRVPVGARDCREASGAGEAGTTGSPEFVTASDELAGDVAIASGVACSLSSLCTGCTCPNAPCAVSNPTKPKQYCVRDLIDARIVSLR